MTKPSGDAERGFFKNGTAWVQPQADRGGLSLDELDAARAAAERDERIARRHPRCQICAHKDRHLIEATKVAGAGLDEVAKRFAVHRDSLWRHMRNHVSDETKISYLAGGAKIQDLANLAADENKGLLEYLSILRSMLFGQLDRSAQRDKPYEVERVGGRVLDVLKEIGRLTGELSSFTAATVNITNNQAVVLNSPIITELQSELMTALAPYPDARRDVIALFVRLDERHRQPEMKLIESRANA